MFSATSAQKMKLGLFLLAGGGLLVVIVLLFAGLSLMEDTDRYYVATDSVSGLREGASVEVRGVRVGEVAELDLDWKRDLPVRIAIDVDQGTPIPASAHAVLSMRGVTGLKYIDVQGGDVRGPLRSPGDTLPTKPSTLSGITDEGLALVKQSRVLIDSGKQVTDRMNELLDDENRARMEQILIRGERAMGDLEKAAAQMARAGARFEQVMAADGARAMAAAADLLADARRLVHANRQNIAATVRDVREAARSLRQMALALERQPSRLLFGGKEGKR
jgi:phospholipid/cholesterol/gamma-HCH transport system substrate-binding protein